MVLKGLRKEYNDDIELQKASIEIAEYASWLEIDKRRLRRSVSWYHAGTGQWCEVDIGVLGNRGVTFNIYDSIPERKLWEYSIKASKTGERHTVESGFIADGLTHAVWVKGGRWDHGKDQELRCLFDPTKSTMRMRQQLIVNINKLPEIFHELYEARISIPQIQIAFNDMKSRQ